jgi:hypothetical protein
MKIGNHTSNSKVSYKVYFGSVEPNFYFAAYIVPSEDTYDMFFIPKVNNILDNGVIDFNDNSANSIKGIQYGEAVELSLSNPSLDGYGRMVNVTLSIDSKPVATQSSSTTPLNIEAAGAIARETIKPIVDIGLYTLANVALIEVEAKLENILQSSVGVNQDTVVPTIIRSILVIRKIFIDNLPSGLTDEQKDKFYTLYMRLLNISPVTSDTPGVFAEAILFARMIKEENIDMFTIPYEILFRLFVDWTKSHHSESVNLLKKASANIEHSESISINMSTMEDTSKVYELLNKTQAFVYLRNIRFINADTGDFEDFPMDNEYYKNYIKSTDESIEQKGIPSSNGVVIIQYGYGTGCDDFIGLFSEDVNGSKRGLRRDDRMIGYRLTTSRTWEWETDKIVKSEGQIDSSGNITVEFTGV